jgi:hypothetical protein
MNSSFQVDQIAYGVQEREVPGWKLQSDGENLADRAWPAFRFGKNSTHQFAFAHRHPQHSYRLQCLPELGARQDSLDGGQVRLHKEGVEQLDKIWRDAKDASCFGPALLSMRIALQAVVRVSPSASGFTID